MAPHELQEFGAALGLDAEFHHQGDFVAHCDVVSFDAARL
jgi:hypothetical protein